MTGRRKAAFPQFDSMNRARRVRRPKEISMFRIMTFRSDGAFWPLGGAVRTSSHARPRSLLRPAGGARRDGGDSGRAGARRAMQTLAGLDERMLRDIGIERGPDLARLPGMVARRCGGPPTCGPTSRAGRNGRLIPLLAAERGRHSERRAISLCASGRRARSAPRTARTR